MNAPERIQIGAYLLTQEQLHQLISMLGATTVETAQAAVMNLRHRLHDLSNDAYAYKLLLDEIQRQLGCKDVIEILPALARKHAQIDNLEAALGKTTGMRLDETPETPLYYLQDSRSYIGNDVLWWGKTGGYTTDLSKAATFSAEDAHEMHERRNSDVAWPKGYIDGKARPAVDMQYIKRVESLNWERAHSFNAESEREVA